MKAPEMISTTAREAISRARSLWIIALVVVATASILLPAFRSAASVNSVLASLAPIILISIGQAIVILSGGIDLSVGAIAGLSTVILSFHSALPVGVSGVLLLAILSGAAIGVSNGIGVVAGINPLLMTFAMAGLIQGAALLMQGTPGTSAPVELFNILSLSPGNIPIMAILAILGVFTAWYWTSQSRIGRVIQALGYDRRIATRLGFPVKFATLLAFGLSGIFSALGGFAIAARTYTPDALVGASSVIDSVATVLVAGILITGGVGSILSVLPAAIVITVVGQIFTLTGTDAYYQTIFKGLLLIGAMGIYQFNGSKVQLRLISYLSKFSRRKWNR